MDVSAAIRRAGRLAAAAICAAAAAGCNPAASLLPDNLDLPTPERSTLAVIDGAELQQEAGLDDALWLQVAATERTPAVGGYLSLAPSPRGALILALSGASMLDPQGPLGMSRRFMDGFGATFVEKGYRVWSLRVRECGAAYGQEDADDAAAAIAWLERSGKAQLGVERVYVFGYSGGASVATMLGRRTDVTAVVSIAGFTSPEQIYVNRLLYGLIAELWPENSGACQLGDSVDVYGRPGDGAWNEFNSIKGVSEFRSPTLFIHGLADFIIPPTSLMQLEAAYKRQVAAGAPLPPLTFWYLPGADHFTAWWDRGVRVRLLEWIEQFEPPYSPPPDEAPVEAPTEAP